MPQDMPNSYTVSLYDLTTWQEVRTSPSPSPSPRPSPSPSPSPNPNPNPNPHPNPNPNQVDVVVDERLARKPDGTGLLGCEPSRDGELWACYLEKAVAAHCGGWDKIDGGQCTHAWSLLTGCKEQYTIRKDRTTGKYTCLGKKNANTGEWEPHANSPHDGFNGLWQMDCAPACGSSLSRSRALR